MTKCLRLFAVVGDSSRVIMRSSSSGSETPKFVSAPLARLRLRSSVFTLFTSGNALTSS